jgi:hypothetical protein
MLALIDADVIVYRTGFASKDVSETLACVRADTTVKDILKATGATEYQLWLSDSLENNFRYKVDPDYKKSRQLTPKPAHYKALKLFLQYEWGAQITEGQEADDELGIRQSQYWGSRSGTGSSDTGRSGDSTAVQSIICSIDKDLRQVPGKHYNFVRNEFFDVEPFDGLVSFYSQFLIGDRVDDIHGIHGLGPKKTEVILKPCTTEIELFEKVRYQYKDDKRLLKNGRLLWVRREPNQMWEFPTNTSNHTTTNDQGTSEGWTKDLQDEGGFSSDSPD